jgi:hypothetical protein
MNPLSALIFWVINNFFWLIGAGFALYAAYAFLVFLRGFLLGLNHLFYIDSNADHVEHARDHVVGGVVALYLLFAIWVNLKMVASLFGFTTTSYKAGFAIDLGFVAFWLLLWLYDYLAKKTQLK